MSNSNQPAEVAAYLRQLDVALADVPKGTAGEIRLGITEELASLSPDDARERLAQLGDPVQIAAEARDGVAPLPEVKPATASPGYIILASVALAVGGVVVPFVGWLVGYVLVCVSPAWRRAEKIAAIAVPVGVSLLVAAFIVVVELQAAGAGAVDELPFAGHLAWWNAAVVVIVANFVMGIWLMIRALRRA